MAYVDVKVSVVQDECEVAGCPNMGPRQLVVKQGHAVKVCASCARRLELRGYGPQAAAR